MEETLSLAKDVSIGAEEVVAAGVVSIEEAGDLVADDSSEDEENSVVDVPVADEADSLAEVSMDEVDEMGGSSVNDEESVAVVAVALSPLSVAPTPVPVMELSPEVVVSVPSDEEFGLELDSVGPVAAAEL